MKTTEILYRVELGDYHSDDFATEEGAIAVGKLHKEICDECRNKPLTVTKVTIITTTRVVFAE